MTETNDAPESVPNPSEPDSAPPSPGAAPAPSAATEAAGQEVDRDARMWAMLCHLTGLVGVLGPLVVWLIKKEDSPFVDEQGKEALNFQITMLIYGVVAGMLCFACIGFILLPAVSITALVLLIIAAIKANDGHHYRYPKYLIFRFIK
jgi:uncharacterized Tic20 family protein